MNILFLGNSFTFFNSMPSIVWEMATSCGIKTHIESITNGGYFLHQYIPVCGNSRGLELTYKLRQEKWDYVVIQDQSSNPATNEDDFLKSASIICEQIKKAGATPVFYQTWAYRDGTEKLASVSMTYDELYSKLRDSYQKAALENNALLVPVGTAMYDAMYRKDKLNLLLEDDFHPNVEGSYLIAYMFFRKLVSSSEIPSFIPERADEEICKTIRNICDC